METFIKAQPGEELWEPRFTYHGFRYVELTGMRNASDESTITARVIGSDAPTSSSIDSIQTLSGHNGQTTSRYQRTVHSGMNVWGGAEMPRRLSRRPSGTGTWRLFSLSG